MGFQRGRKCEALLAVPRNKTLKSKEPMIELGELAQHGARKKGGPGADAEQKKRKKCQIVLSSDVRTLSGPQSRVFHSSGKRLRRPPAPSCATSPSRPPPPAELYIGLRIMHRKFILRSQLQPSPIERGGRKKSDDSFRRRSERASERFLSLTQFRRHFFAC